VNSLTPDEFAEHIKEAVLTARQSGNRFGLYEVSSVVLDGDYPDTTLVVRAVTRRAGDIGWRFPLFDGESDWQRLRDFGRYADVDRFAFEVVFELDEGIDGEVFEYGPSDEQGIRWVTNP